MGSSVEITPHAAKAIRALDKPVRLRIRRFLEERLDGAEDPASLGTRLVSDSTIWRYRVGDYRVLCHLEADVLLVLVVDVAHRRDVYR